MYRFLASHRGGSYRVGCVDLPRDVSASAVAWPDHGQLDLAGEGPDHPPAAAGQRLQDLSLQAAGPGNGNTGEHGSGLVKEAGILIFKIAPRGFCVDVETKT